MTYKYDVFISYSRKDYKDEATKAEIPGNPITAITEAFDKNNISYWIDRDGIYSGQEFRDKIIDAIATSSVFLFVSSHNSNKSIWTKREILEASDSGKYIIPFKIDDCEYDRSVKFELRPLDFIEYFSDKDGALQDLVRSVNMYKEELAKEEKKQLEAKLKAEITEKIRTLEEDFKISVQRHEVTLKEILDLHTKLGTTTKICPICDKKVPLEATFCERCGWQFPALLSSDVDRKQLTLLKANWKIINTATTSKDEIKALKNENLELKETIDNISKELEKFQKEKAQMADEKAILNTQIQDLKAQIRDLCYQINEKDKLSQKTSVELSDLTLKLEETKKNNQELEQQLNQLDKKFHSKEEEYQVLLETSKVNEDKYKSQIAKQKNQIAEITNRLDLELSKQKIASKKKKLADKQYIFDIILPQCKDKITSINLDDDKDAINLSKLIKLLKDDYGVIMDIQQFNYCYTVLGIVNQIAAQANVS